MRKLGLFAIISLGVLIPSVFALDQSINIPMSASQSTNPFTISASNGTNYFLVDSNGLVKLIKNHKLCLDLSCVTYLVSDGSTITLGPTSFSGNITLAKTGFPNTEIDAGSGLGAASYVIGFQGTNYFEKNGTTGQIILSSSKPETVIADAISHGGNIYISSGTYTMSGTFSGFTISGSRTHVIMATNTVLVVPTGYTGYVFKLDRNAINNVIEGGYLKENTPSKLWYGIKIQAGAGSLGTSMNTIRDMRIDFPHTAITFNGSGRFSNEYANNNLFSNIMIYQPIKCLDQNYTGYLGSGSLQTGFTLEQFNKIDCELSGLASSRGFYIDNGNGESFYDTKVFDSVNDQLVLGVNSTNTFIIGGALTHVGQFTNLSGGLGTNGVSIFDHLTGLQVQSQQSDSSCNSNGRQAGKLWFNNVTSFFKYCAGASTSVITIPALSATETFSGTVTMNTLKAGGDVNAQGFKIINLGQPVNANDSSRMNTIGNQKLSPFGNPTNNQVLTFNATNSTAMWESIPAMSTQVLAPSYIIYNSGSTYYAENGTSGMVEFSSTNASSILQSSENKLSSNGGTIIFRSGTFPVHIIVPKSGIIFEGQGRSTILTRDGDNRIFDITGNSHTIIRTELKNLFVSGGSTGTTDCIYAKETSLMKFQNIIMSGCNGKNGIYFEEVYDTTLDGLYVTSSGNITKSTAAIYLYSGALDNTNNIHITNSDFETQAGTDIVSYGSGSGALTNYMIIIDKDKFESHNSNVQYHINYTHTQNSVVSKSVISSAINSNILLQSSASGIKILNNEIISNLAGVGTQPSTSLYGINNFGQNNTIDGNRIYFMQNADIQINSGALNSIISPNNELWTNLGQRDINGTLSNILIKFYGTPKFNTTATTSAMRISGTGADPTTVNIGDIWYRSDLGLLRLKTAAGSSNILDSIDSSSMINKQLFDTSVFFENISDPTKKFKFLISGMGTGITLTITPNQTTTQHLNIPDITSTDTFATLGLAETFTKPVKINQLNASSGIVDDNVNTKKITFLNSGMTAGITTTIRNNATTSQGINIPVTNGTTNFTFLESNQTFTGQERFNPTKSIAPLRLTWAGTPTSLGNGDFYFSTSDNFPHYTTSAGAVRTFVNAESPSTFSGAKTFQAANIVSGASGAFRFTTANSLKAITGAITIENTATSFGTALKNGAQYQNNTAQYPILDYTTGNYTFDIPRNYTSDASACPTSHHGGWYLNTVNNTFRLCFNLSGTVHILARG